jgi:hypothetical protein
MNDVDKKEKIEMNEIEKKAYKIYNDKFDNDKVIKFGILFSLMVAMVLIGFLVLLSEYYFRTYENVLIGLSFIIIPFISIPCGVTLMFFYIEYISLRNDKDYQIAKKIVYNFFDKEKKFFIELKKKTEINRVLIEEQEKSILKKEMKDDIKELENYIKINKI